jgi:hypothetical protein
MVIRDKTVDTLTGNTIVIEVTHSILDRTLYFSLMRKYLLYWLGYCVQLFCEIEQSNLTEQIVFIAEATIEPLVTWLRVSFADPAISGMVLQYKGFDGLWKCLLNSG